MKSRHVFAWVGVASLTAIAFAATQIARFAGDAKTEIAKGKIIRSGYVAHTTAFQSYNYRYYQQQMAYANTAAGSGEPIIEINGQLQFGLPGKPIFPSLGDDTIMKPTLDWLLRSDKAGKTTGELSYVTGGMN